MIGLLRRVGGVMLAPRRLFAGLSPGTGRYDGAALLAAYMLAVGVPELGAAIADFWALLSLSAAPGLLRALLPALPWLVTLMLVEWRLGAARTWGAALCLVPLLAIHGVANGLALAGLAPAWPELAPAALGGLASLLLAERARPAIAPEPTNLAPGTASPHLSPGTASPNLSPGTAPSARLALALGAAIAALIATTGAAALTRLAQRWPTLAPVAQGDPLPTFTAPLLDGGTFKSTDLRGAPHLLIFWTTWCGVCRGEMPMYRELADRYRERGLVVVAVDADRDGDVPALARAYRAEHGLPFPIALDSRGELTRGFRVKMYPHLVLVDADGRIRDVRQGRAMERGLAAAIEAVLPPT